MFQHFSGCKRSSDDEVISGHLKAAEVAYISVQLFSLKDACDVTVTALGLTKGCKAPGEAEVEEQEYGDGKVDDEEI